MGIGIKLICIGGFFRIYIKIVIVLFVKVKFYWFFGCMLVFDKIKFIVSKERVIGSNCDKEWRSIIGYFD